MRTRIDWIDTPKREKIGPITITGRWYYDEDSYLYHDFMGEVASKPTDDYYFDRRRGVIYGPRVKIQRTFTKREIALHEVDTRKIYRYRYPMEEITYTFDELRDTNPKNNEVGSMVLRNTIPEWTEDSEKEFVEKMNILLQREDDYPDVINTERFEDSGYPEEMEWVLEEVFEDGSARYESDEPEVLAAGLWSNYGSHQYEYIQGFQYRPEGDEKEEHLEYIKQDVKRLEELFRGDWCYIWLGIEAELNGQVIASASLSGIESDAEDYHLEVYKDVRSEVISQIQAELPRKEERIKSIEFSYTEAETALAQWLEDQKEESSGQT